MTKVATPELHIFENSAKFIIEGIFSIPFIIAMFAIAWFIGILLGEAIIYAVVITTVIAAFCYVCYVGYNVLNITDKQRQIKPSYVQEARIIINMSGKKFTKFDIKTTKESSLGCDPIV